MRIKFLSFIASFFMVSFVITSCLDNDNNIEYSPDATIHAFELDTIGGYGVKYKFTIDQLSREIYNEDSLPVHADTIIDKILIKTLTTASGVITMKDKSGNDSIININDSIDLREPLTIKVWSTEALAGISPNQTKEYTIKVRVHKHDPDSLRWDYVGKYQDAITNAQKTIKFVNDYFTYSIQDSKLKVYTSNNLSNWSAKSVTGLSKLPNSIIPLNKIILATSDNRVYSSTNGINWELSDKFSDNVTTFVSKLPINDETDFKITYIKEKNQKRYWCSILESDLTGTIQEQNLGEVDSDFPIDNISYATFKKGKQFQNVVVGKHEPVIKTTVNNKEVPVIVTWGYNGTTWAKIGTTSQVAYCPGFENPTIIYYNGLLYIWGDKFESIYVSDSEGFAWKKVNKKFSFPNHNWNESILTVSTKEKPEFRGRTKYSVIQDMENKYIYVLFGKETNVTFKEEVKKKEKTQATELKDRGPYNHDSEIWRGRLNQLWFDLDPTHAGE